MSQRACGFVIFRRLRGQIEYLLLQTSYGKHHWTPPKGIAQGFLEKKQHVSGHVDPGESDMVTALRETEEEAGFEKKDLNVFENVKRELVYPVNEQSKTVVYWLAELVNREKDAKLSKEHQDFRWLGIEEACQLSGYDDMKQVLRYFDEYVVSNC